MKSLFLIPAALLMAAPVQAVEAELTIGDATDIRRCPVDGEMYRGVCYNQKRSLGFPLFTVERNRAYSIDCERNFKGQLGRTYCPVRFDLEPAPFLQ